MEGWLWVVYSLHQLLRYVAAHSGWHLLLPVMGDSQRVPNGAEALGDRLMALVFPRRLLLQMPQPKPKHR